MFSPKKKQIYMYYMHYETLRKCTEFSVYTYNLRTHLWRKQNYWTIIQKGTPGFEPGTSRSAVECSNTELYLHASIGIFIVRHYFIKLINYFLLCISIGISYYCVMDGLKFRFDLTERNCTISISTFKCSCRSCFLHLGDIAQWKSAGQQSLWSSDRNRVSPS